MERSILDYFVKIVMGEYPNNHTYRIVGLFLGALCITLFPLALLVRILPGLVMVVLSDKFYTKKKVFKKIGKNTLPWILGLFINIFSYLPLLDEEVVTSQNILDVYLLTFSITLIPSMLLFITISLKQLKLLNK